jgi:hypothetical protein
MTLGIVLIAVSLSGKLLTQSPMLNKLVGSLSPVFVWNISFSMFLMNTEKIFMFTFLNYHFPSINSPAGNGNFFCTVMTTLGITYVWVKIFQKVKLAHGASSTAKLGNPSVLKPLDDGTTGLTQQAANTQNYDILIISEEKLNTTQMITKTENNLTSNTPDNDLIMKRDDDTVILF